MQITVVCDNCQKVYAADSSMVGRRIRCRGCGNIVTIANPNAPEPTDVPDLNSLAQVERSFAAGDVPGGTQVQPGHQLPAGMEDVPLSGEGIEQAGRANLRFNFAGSRELDLLLPWLLIVGSVAWIFLQSSRTNRTDAGWITLTSSLAWLGLYAGIIWPLTFVFIRQAGRIAGFQLPRTARFRSFASFMPALVISASLWMLGHGAIASGLMGAIGGLLVAACCVWVLFRLRPEEVPVTAGLASTGYLMGLVVSAAMLFGLNTLARSIVDATQTTAVPMSPFGAGFRWEPITKSQREDTAARSRTRTVRAERADPSAPTPQAPVVSGPVGPPPVEKPLAEAAVATAASAISRILPTGAVADLGPQIAVPTSPVVASFSPASAMRQPADRFIVPLTASPFVAALSRTGDDISITCWDSRTWKRVNAMPLRLKAAQGNDDFVLSPDGTRIARTATFIRREIEIHSFESPGRAPETIALNEAAGAMQTLLGFLPAEGEGAAARAERILISVDAGGKLLINAFDLARKMPVRLKPLELPLPEGGRELFGLTAGGRYFALVGPHTDRRVPAVRFFSMNAERPVASHEVQIGDLPAGWSPVPAGFAVTTDSTAEAETLAAVLFEHPGGAIIFAYRQANESKAGQYIDRVGQLPKRPPGFSGPALLWVGAGKDRRLLVYGTALVDLAQGQVVGTIDIDRIRGVSLSDETTLLITADSDRHPIPARVELKLDGSLGSR